MNPNEFQQQERLIKQLTRIADALATNAEEKEDMEQANALTLTRLAVDQLKRAEELLARLQQHTVSQNDLRVLLKHYFATQERGSVISYLRNFGYSI